MQEANYGFIYIGKSLAETLNYQEGMKIDLVPSQTPCLVHYDTATIVINEWPGQLWFVKVLDDLPTTWPKANLELIPTQSFKLIKQLVNSFLFGSKGEGICELLDKIQQLDLSQVKQLATFFSPIAAEAYAVAWNNWLQQTTNLVEHRDADHTGTLAIGKGENSSPIYSGFLLVNELVYQKARQLEGDSAFISYPAYDESEALLNPQWNKACSVLLQAAMALGAEQYVDAKDLNLLLTGWRLLTQC